MKEWVRIEFWGKADVEELTQMISVEALATRLGLGDLFEAMDELQITTQGGHTASPWVREANT